MSGAFYIYVLAWPFLVLVDPFFTFFVIIYRKHRDARYASVVTFYSCCNVLLAIAVLFVPLLVRNRVDVLGPMFGATGTWPYFVLLPVRCDLVGFVSRRRSGSSSRSRSRRSRSRSRRRSEVIVIVVAAVVVAVVVVAVVVVAVV